MLATSAYDPNDDYGSGEYQQGDEKKFLMAEIKYLESYLRQVLEYDQMGEHKPSIEKFHANMMAIHTYLIASEILKYIS